MPSEGVNAHFKHEFTAAHGDDRFSWQADRIQAGDVVLEVRCHPCSSRPQRALDADRARADARS